MTVAYQLKQAGTSLSKTTVERRPLGPRDVRLELKYCGICHSDLVAAGDKLGGGMYPMVPGAHAEAARAFLRPLRRDESTVDYGGVN